MADVREIELTWAFRLVYNYRPGQSHNNIANIYMVSQLAPDILPNTEGDRNR